MNIKYIRPVIIETPLTVSAKLTDDSKPPKIRSRGEIRDREGHLFVRAEAEFVEVSREDFKSVPNGLKEDMLSLFERLSD